MRRDFLKLFVMAFTISTKHVAPYKNNFFLRLKSAEVLGKRKGLPTQS